MSKINFEDIQEYYETALAEKEVNTQGVNTAIIDNNLNDKFISIQNEKEQISSLEDLGKYQNKLKSFFDEVYKIITAPGVQKFIDWLNELSSKGLEPKISNHITESLIGEYAAYDESIKSIIKNKNVIEPNGSLFENIKKSVKENINKRIVTSFSSKEKVEEELSDFIEELDDLLEGLSEIEKLCYTDVKNFYTANFDDRNNDDYVAEINEEADFFYDLIKQVVEKKDFLTTDKDKIQLSTIVKNVQSSIDDIDNSIETIKTIDISVDSEDNIKILYNKFEESLNFKTGQANISDSIEESINDTWEKIISAYNLCQDFYTNYTKEKINKLESNKSKWSIQEFKFDSKIEQYILTLNNVISDNPLSFINKYNISKIKSAYTKVENSINSLKENNPKETITEYFSSITSDYKNKRIGILKKLKTEESKVEKIEKAVDEINNFISNISNSDNLLDALNDDFVDGILGSFEYIKKEFTSAIEKSDIKEDLDYLDKISSDGNVLSKSDLETNLERFKRLLEYDLININLTKNI